MDRRHFLHGCLAGAGTAPLLAHAGLQTATPGKREPFALDYAPHFGMFREHGGGDLLDELAFMADEGFRSLEDNGMGGRPVEQQEAIGAALRKHDMRMGVFVAHAAFGRVTFASRKREEIDKLEADMRKAVEVAQRVDARWCTVVPGRLDLREEPQMQTGTVIDNLRRACDILEPAGLTMVLEPLNRRDHPGLFLVTTGQAFSLCRAVDRPSCKILFDVYHQQISEGNLIPNIERAWDEIAYFQVGDNPGRKEPTTGEIHYGNVFRRIRARGFTGIVGMEHGNSRPGRDGERAVIDAYRSLDPT